MTENQDPTATTEDVQGHMPPRKFADDGDDTEGHVFRGRGFADDTDDTDDTEGHSLRGRGFADDTDDDN